MRHLVAPLTLVLATLAWSPPAAHADTLGFACITAPTTSLACNIGQSQLSVEVLAGSGAQAGLVGFTFRNVGPSQAAISEIYFDDGTLLAQSTIVNGMGVSFVPGATPGNLPGGNAISPAFNVTQGFLAEASNPAPANGVGPGEAVSIYYTLQGGQTLDDTLFALSTGALRVGLHVIGYADGSSASFVNSAVPLPAALLLLGSGLFGAGALLRRRAFGDAPLAHSV